MNREKPNIKCPKCEYQWHTRSTLQMVSCPSCNQKIRNSVRTNILEKFIHQKRGIVGLETAIILIAFVIIAAAFSFMVINMGLFATQRGKSVIQNALAQADTPLMVDGTILVRTTPDGQAVNLIVIPIKAFGDASVDMGRNQTVVALTIGDVSYPNAYLGTLHVGYPNGASYNATDAIYDPTGQEFDNFTGVQLANQTAAGAPCNIYVNETYSNGYAKGLPTGVTLAIANTIGGDALTPGEEGYLLVTLGLGNEVGARASIDIEIRVENSATLTIDITTPASMPPSSYVPTY